MSELREEQCELRRAAAMSEFPAAQSLAADHGLLLIQRSDTHYQLKGGQWILNIYPGNLNIHWAKMRTFLELPAEWKLADVVKACAEFDSKLKVV